MKKLINNPCRMTLETIEGYVSAFPGQVRRVGCQALTRADAPIPGKVSVIAGGGSGHEPLFMGYLGRGMADGCSVGNVFTSPSAEMVLEATRAAFGGAGVLYLYGNDAGDAMNFDLAAEEAAEEGIRIETVRVTDDIASAPPDQVERRRGIAGGFFVLKAAGARAEEGATLEEVYASARKANENTRSMGVVLSSASGGPIFQLADHEMELGLGIEAKPGAHRRNVVPADAVTGELVRRILDDLPFQAGDEVAVLVNGLGSTPLGELYIVFRRAAHLLANAGIEIHRSYVGEYRTSLETAGASITIMQLDDELHRLVDAPAACPCFVQF